MGIADVMSVSSVNVGLDASACDAVKKMVAANVGSTTITDGPRLVGIFSERDVMRLAADGVSLESLPVRDVMTTDVVTVPPEADVLHAAALMGKHRVRHLPVVQDGNLLGVVGIRDVLAALVQRAATDPEARDRVRDLLARQPAKPTWEPEVT
jgi:CBS domain-containing protein